MDNKELRELVTKIFKENKTYFDFYVHDDKIEIEVFNGDWKHEHLFLKHIMRENMLFAIKEEQIGESDDDSYSARYTFTHKDYSKEIDECVQNFETLEYLSMIALKDRESVDSIILEYLRDNHYIPKIEGFRLVPIIIQKLKTTAI